jgi:hypothetical protein
MNRQCLLDAYQIDECPNCHKSLVSEGVNNTQQILCHLNNEGGLQENLDIFPLLKEESYLKAYPEERKARAFLEFCRSGDLQAVIEMIQSSKEDEGEDMGPSMDEIFRYQDPIGDRQSGLHAAVAAGSREIAWLLLLLASELELTEFPPEAFQEVKSMGIMREEKRGLVDIRTLRDDEGRTAEDVARGLNMWNGWIGNARLAA